MNIVKSILWIVIVIVILLAFYIVYTKYINTKKETFKEKSKITIALFHAKWCHFCVSLIDSKVFEKAENDVKKYTNDITFIKYDADQNKQLVKKYNISGFPTIYALSSNGTLIDTFNGDRENSDDLKQFALDSLTKI